MSTILLLLEQELILDTVNTTASAVQFQMVEFIRGLSHTVLDLIRCLLEVIRFPIFLNVKRSNSYVQESEQPQQTRNFISKRIPEQIQVDIQTANLTHWGIYQDEATADLRFLEYE